ncbi:hypothetical protein SAMN05445060_3607 [Williamsia sterculiae]|uniref:Uncharacterized protein n=1 Tax=Williamsia sterculiae TaxID=1344003 RepID=A0A1N7H6K2_9NOCA|nr:hypothetical protein SAMN05445060_3607 [Williamsia sterculiae]
MAAQPGAATIPVPAADVTVQTPGSAPASLQRRPDRDAVQKVTLSATSTATTMDPGTSASAVPSAAAGGSQLNQTVGFRLAVQRGCDASDDVAATVLAATTDDASQRTDVQTVAGTRFGVSLSAGYAPVALQVLPATTATDAGRSTLEQTLVQTMQEAVTLPSQPMGVGARWVATRTLAGPVRLTQTVTAILTHRDGDLVSIDFTVDEQPQDSRYSLPNGQNLTIDSYRTSGQGSVTIDLTRGLPVAGDTRIVNARSLSGAEGSTPLVQQTTFEQRWNTR